MIIHHSWIVGTSDSINRSSYRSIRYRFPDPFSIKQCRLMRNCRYIRQIYYVDRYMHNIMRNIWCRYNMFCIHIVCIIDPFSKDLKLPWNEVGSGVPTSVIFIYSICFKHFLIDLGFWNFGCRFRSLFCMRLFKKNLNWTPISYGEA